VIDLYRGLAVSGIILGLFGLFLVVTDLFVPLGASIFGLPIAIIGAIMFALGLVRPEPAPVEPSPGKKFCWYCMKEIDKNAKECPFCSLDQHAAEE